jgi:electron transfer flavoprotein alpha/beta subunit
VDGRVVGVEIAVLAKVVPDADAAGFDPARRTMRRDGSSLFLNPFDQRALRAAIELRRPNERVTVVSMGPPAVESAVAETLMLGADHAVLVSDPALAGSDSLVTARVLARVLERGSPGFVVCGQWSTDSETGQVPAQVAALLDLPLVRAARRLRRHDTGEGIEATVDTEEGTATVSAGGPAVITVGEKIGKPLKPGEASRASPSSPRLERLDLGRLGFAADEVGEPGSPTHVARLVDRAPRRAGLVFDDGEVADRVVRALVALRQLLRERPPAPQVLPPPLARASRGRVGVLVTDELGALDPSALSLLGRTGRDLPSRSRGAIWLSSRSPAGADRRAIGSVATALTVFPAEPGWTARTAAAGIGHWAAERDDLDALFLPATGFGRELGGRLSASRSLGLVGDVIEFGEGEDGAIVCEKPSFGGGVVAEIRTRTSPLLATLRADRSSVPSADAGREPDLERGPSIAADPHLRWSGHAKDPEDGLPDPDRAMVVLSLGVGASSDAALAAARRAAAAWGAALVGTRRVVDAGLLPVRRQAGLTGRSIAADLGVLLGVRGSPNHLVAWRRTRALLAVNVERSAPVFAGADVGIVGSWEEVLPLLEPEVPRIVRGD